YVSLCGFAPLHDILSSHRRIQVETMRPASSTICVPSLPRGLAGVIVAVMFRRSWLLLFFVSRACVGADADRAQEARFLKNTRQLIYEGKRSGEGYFHPDGKRIIFQS